MSPPRRILLVDDDRTTARGIALILKSSGAAVDHAGTGEEGINLTASTTTASSSSTCCYPIDECEVVRRLRDAQYDAPILILSGVLGLR
jgi:two-component system cell cycle response regulator CtrA